MTKKTCSCCGSTKNITMFSKNGKDKEGNVRYRNECRECYNIKRKIRNINKFVNNTKHRTGESGTYAIKDWKASMIFFKASCAYCGRPCSRKTKLTKDHIVAVSKGGKTTRHNIAPACKRCNSSKGDKELVEWYSKQKCFSHERMRRLRDWSDDYGTK